MKKIISTLLSIAMMLTLTTSVFAAQHSNKLTSDPNASVTMEITSYSESTKKVTFQIALNTAVCTVTNGEDAWFYDEEENPLGFSNVSSIDAFTLYYQFASSDIATSAAAVKFATAAGASKTGTNGRGVLYTTILDGFKDKPMMSATFATDDPSCRYLPAAEDFVIKGTFTLKDTFAAGKDLATLQEMFANNTLGHIEFVSATLDTYGTYGDDEVKTYETCLSTRESDADYMFKSITPNPSSSAGPVVPEYKTEKTKEIMETKAGTYATEPTVDDTGKGLYWLINFKQQATDQYISADIQRFNSSGELLKQQSILVKLDDDGDSNKFVGEGDRAAYIFMENVPAGKYKGSFYISETGKPEDSIPLFYDKNFIVVE